MRISNNEPPERENIDAQDEFLKNIKIWQKRLRIEHSILTFTIIVLAIIIELGWAIFIGRLENYIESFGYAWLAFGIAAFAFSIWIGFKITKSFPKLLIANKEFFESEEVFKKFKKHVRDTFRSKKELYIPLIIAIFTSIYCIYGWYASNWQEGGWGEPIQFEGIVYVIQIIRQILWLILFDILLLVSISGLVLVVLAFKCLNRLGTKEFPLNVSYKELKMGGFYDLGKFIISLTIPGILLSTFMSTLGLGYIFISGDFIGGYIWIFGGIIINLTFIIILYKNTINIHKAIVKYKSELKAFLLLEIEKYTTSTSDEIDYHKIHDIHEYYDKIDGISDWPFNPTSFKKLIITLSSTFIPLGLSLFGFI